MTYMIEHLMDTAALEMNIDPAELRRTNFIPAFNGVDEPGYQTQVALQYDSGNYHATLDRALEMVGYEQFRKDQEESRKNGKLLGIGFSTYIEACGIAPSAVVGSLEQEPDCLKVHTLGSNLPDQLVYSLDPIRMVKDTKLPTLNL